MNAVSRALPLAGLGDLTNESRMISAPWSRMIRGIGLGQYPIDYDPVIAGHIRQTFDKLAAKVRPSNYYTLFCRALADFVLMVEDPKEGQRDRIAQAVGPLLDAARAEPNPYYRAMAGSLAMDSFAKLGLDLSLLVNDELDFPAEVLATLDEIAQDQIKDENQGRHGHYERLSASSTVFLATGQLGLKDRLVTADRNYVIEALNLLENIPAPYFRGRSGSMFMSVVALLGYERYIFDGKRNYMKEVLDYLSRADELKIYPSFPHELPLAWSKIYPLVTMLNAIAMCGRAEYLDYQVDWLAEARTLMEEIPWDDRVHMSQYYIIALHNLGRLGDQLPDLDTYLRKVAAVLNLVDPGGNFFPNGIAYPYIIETAMQTGHMSLIPDEALERMVESFPSYNRTAEDHANSAFPVSYVLNVLGEIGAADLIFSPRAHYADHSAIEWVIENMSAGAKEEGTRLYMINHALVSYALRLRGANAPETALFSNFQFRLASVHHEDGNRDS